MSTIMSSLIPQLIYFPGNISHVLSSIIPILTFCFKIKWGRYNIVRISSQVTSSFLLNYITLEPKLSEFLKNCDIYMFCVSLIF